ncbi:MAG: hypothetical protein ABF430_00600 [Acetobacter persici]|uniref:hypothetical protein n=1 Tax=Acetobacter persici TaxID=1076596 RepID=UPI0039E9A2C1
MMRFPFMRCAFAFVGLSAGVSAVNSSAHAERVISDLEASKLTFASLTAVPAPVVHVHRASHASHVVHVASHQSHSAASHSMVHLVSYHPARHAASHAATRRHRT